MNKLSNLFKDIHLKVAKKQIVKNNNFSSSVTNMLNSAFRWFDICLKNLPLEPTYQQLTYKSVIAYFIEQTPSDPKVSKGAMLRQSNPRGELTIIQIFLDEQNELICQSNGKPYGRRLVVQEMDEEVTNCFGKEDIIIFE